MPKTQLSRRGLAKGAAWSIPAITVASSAPALAASPLPPQMHNYFYVSYNEDQDGNIDDSTDFKFYSIVPGSTDPGPGFYVDNTTTSTTITNASVTVYLPQSGLTWTNEGGSGWTTPTADATKATKSYNGQIYYPYTIRYTGTIAAQNGTTYLPAYSFESNDSVHNTQYFYGDWSASVNGKVQTTSKGPATMQ